MQIASFDHEHSAYGGGMQAAYASFMEGESLRRARRRKKLAALLETVGGPTQAETDTGTPRTHFVAMVKGRRGLGDALAAKLEAQYKKAPGWFDEDDGAYWPFSDELQAAVVDLDDQACAKLENVMRAHLDMPPLRGAPALGVVRSEAAESAPLASEFQPAKASPSVGKIGRKA